MVHNESGIRRRRILLSPSSLKTESWLWRSVVLLRLLSGLLRVRIPSAVSAAVVQLAEHLRRSCDRVPQPQSLRGVVWGYFVSNTNGQCIQVSSPSALILYLVRLCSTQITSVPWRMLALLRLWIAKSASTIVYHGTHIIPVAWRRRYFAANEIGSNPTRGGTNPRVLTPSFASFGLTGLRHLAVYHRVLSAYGERWRYFAADLEVVG